VIRTLTGHKERVSVAVTPDGRYLASANYFTAKLWDAANGLPQTLASAGEDTTVRLWDVPTGAERAILEGHTDQVRSVAFGPDSPLRP
jgi:WD40 repeat protein